MARHDVGSVAGASATGAGGRSSEGATVHEGATNRENDTEGHGGSENCSHAGDNSLNGIPVIGGSRDEPEEHVSHVNNPDSLHDNRVTFRYYAN